MTWRLARSLEVLKQEIKQLWPGTVIWSIGDASHVASNSDHNPNEDNIVCAIDVVGSDVAARIWDHILTRQDQRVKYMIFKGRIVSTKIQPWVIRNYHGMRSNPHNNHVHISVGRGLDGHSTGPQIDDETSWGFVVDVPLPEMPSLPIIDDRPTKGQIVTLPLLTIGSEGQYVRNMQGLLVAHGNHLEVDGFFGPITDQVLRDWQRATQSLGVDGACGPNTWSWLTGVV